MDDFFVLDPYFGKTADPDSLINYIYTPLFLKTKIDESVTSAFEVLRKRIDKFGVTQPNIQRLGNSGRILVELPGAKDVERVKGLLQSTAQLEFWDAFKGEEFLSFMIQANEVIKSKTSTEEC